MASYRYTGPLTGLTYAEGGKLREVMLFRGQQVELPEDNETVKTLVALGRLALVDGAAAPTATPAAASVSTAQPDTPVESASLSAAASTSAPAGTASLSTSASAPDDGKTRGSK